MKTAMIKTTIWKDDNFCQMPIDTQYLFLYLSTSPERNTTRFYQQRENVIASYVGMIPDVFRECMKQLSDKGFAYYLDGWVIIGNDSYVQPSKGKDTYNLYAKDYSKVPAHVIDYAEKMIPNSSRAAQECISNSISKGKGKGKSKSKGNSTDTGKGKETIGAILKAGI